MGIPIVSNFVAGTSTQSAVNHARTVNDRGITVILNYLGEHHETRRLADEDTNEYVSLVEEIGAADVDACLSVKPSQIGLDVDESEFRKNLGKITRTCRREGVFLWIDMEDHTTTDVTLNAYESLTEEYEDIGVCVQANLKRTPEDLLRLTQLPGKVRLVKGAYSEPKHVAYQDKSRIDDAYRECLRSMFSEFNGGIAVGSHDPEMIQFAKSLSDEFGTDFEVQMLMGVRESAQDKLVDEGISVYQYVPYGERWFSYFYRRIREKKENALFALRAVAT